MHEPARTARTVANEGDLCRIWEARAFPDGRVTTSSGERLQVIYPGRRGGGAGPDFRAAILSDENGRLCCGDVELHLRAHDWISHGHRADPAFNTVVLHVVLEDDGTPCVCADGRPVPVASLGAWIVPSLIVAADTAVIALACRVSPALSAAQVGELVREAGRTRLEQKARALEAQVVALGSEQALFTALLDAAGYSRNRVPCALLAERVPIERLHELLAGKPSGRAAAIAKAVLLGQAGLLPRDDDLAPLWSAYADLWPLPPLQAGHWVRMGVRPANRPEMRLHGIAMLAARTARTGLAHTLLAPLRDSAKGMGWAERAEQLVGVLEVPARQGERTPPIGRGRAVEMAINVVIPFALAQAQLQEDAVLEAASWAVAACLPAGDDSDPLRYMKALLAGAGHKLRVAGALESQGLLHLYRSYCNIRACWECPLADHGAT